MKIGLRPKISKKRTPNLCLPKSIQAIKPDNKTRSMPTVSSTKLEVHSFLPMGKAGFQAGRVECAVDSLRAVHEPQASDLVAAADVGLDEELQAVGVDEVDAAPAVAPWHTLQLRSRWMTFCMLRFTPPSATEVRSGKTSGPGTRQMPSSYSTG